MARAPALGARASGVHPRRRSSKAYESVRLFVERARGRDPSFSLSPQNALAVAEICRRLEGIPLAIELAAARVGTLSVEQISQRLTDSLKLLTGGSTTQMPRQRTLKGTLDWSHELLSEEEKKLSGGSRSSRGDGRWRPQRRWVRERASRRARSWICSPGWWRSLWWWPRRATKEAVRYRLLEPIRQYAREKLEESGEGEEVRRRHAAFFLALAEEAEPRLRGPEDREWLERLEREHDNLRAALSWALERGEAELGLRLAGALGTVLGRARTLRRGEEVAGGSAGKGRPSVGGSESKGPGGGGLVGPRAVGPRSSGGGSPRRDRAERRSRDRE